MAKRENNNNETNNEKKSGGAGKFLLGCLVGGGLAILGGTVAYGCGYMNAASDVTKFVEEKRKEGIEG